jgi:methionyl-tRNA formyltransferase
LNPIKVVFFGTPEFAVPTLEALIQHPDFVVVAVVTQPDKRRGRGGELSPSPIKRIAQQHDCPVFQPQRLKTDPTTIAALKDYAADCFVVVAYGQILSQEILDLPRYGCINGHGSLLPQYRGAAPIQWCLYHGETDTGMTTMLMDIGMDTGAMLLKSHYPIGRLENAQDLARILSQQCAELVLTTLPQWVAGALSPMPQNNAEATYASLIQKTHYEIDWTKSAIAIHNQVRGFYPNCLTSFRGNPLKIVATVPLARNWLDQLPTEYTPMIEQYAHGQADVKPGQILGLAKQQGIVIQTGQDPLLLKEVQPSGKKSQSGWDFANGLRLEPGELLPS